MIKLVFSLVLVWPVAAVMWVLTASPGSAAGPLETTGDVRWIVFASRQNLDEAIGLARGFGSDFGAPMVISTTNGWYAVAAGPVHIPDPIAMKRRLSESRWPPKDTFFTKGMTFVEKVWVRSIGVARPSFDCRKARTPSEIAICRSPRLAELDDILAAGYGFIKTTHGLRAADAIGIPYWRAIRQCGGDPTCIAQRQSEEISALAAAGAPVSLPAWVLAPANAPQPQASPPAPADATVEPNPSPQPDHEESSGTGFFVTTDGAMITNAHVVENCATVNVTPDEGPAADARIVARDVRNDLALLRTGLRAKKVAAFRSSIRLGEEVEAFGYPLAEVLAKSGNFTLGNVSALVGIGEDSRYLQISAPVQPGNSGGPLLDQNGNVVGVVSAKLNALKMMLATNGDIPQNVNFAIKASIVTNFMETNGVAYATGGATQPVQPADLADQAKAMSAFIECR